MPLETVASYQAPNGDTWLLRRDRQFRRHVVLHLPQGATQDQCGSFELPAFEKRFQDTPQYLELRRQVAQVRTRATDR